MLWHGEVIPDLPCVLISGSEPAPPKQALRLPSCPVIFVGDESNILASVADAVVSNDAAAHAIVKKICANPLAAAVV
ncbi:MAG: hypothetical protein RLZZ136_1416, partial [Pseudomonadota bacterium]